MRIGCITLAFCLGACSQVPDSAFDDLQDSLLLVGDVTSFETEAPYRIDEDLLAVPFRAAVRLSTDMRNQVAHAREGRHQREYVGWVIQHSTSQEGRNLLKQRSLLENLSAEPWFEKRAGERVNIEGELRYRQKKDGLQFLGVFEGAGPGPASF